MLGSISLDLICNHNFMLSKLKKFVFHYPVESIIFAVFFLYLMAIVSLIPLRKVWEGMVWHDHEIRSFAGCFHESKSSWDSYETMTDQEIEASLKALGISKREFEKRKGECIRSHQLESFAGCIDTKHPWKRWDEMDEVEFKETLKHFNIKKDTFDYLRDGCSSGHWF